MNAIIELVVPTRYQDRAFGACGGSRGKSPRTKYQYNGNGDSYADLESSEDTLALLDDGRWCSLKSWSLLLSRACLLVWVAPLLLAQLNFLLGQVTPAVYYFIVWQGGVVLFGLCATVFGLVAICVSNTARRYQKRVWARPLCIGLLSILLPVVWDALQPKPAGLPRWRVARASAVGVSAAARER